MQVSSPAHLVWVSNALGSFPGMSRNGLLSSQGTETGERGRLLQVSRRRISKRGLHTRLLLVSSKRNRSSHTSTKSYVYEEAFTILRPVCSTSTPHHYVKDTFLEHTLGAAKSSRTHHPQTRTELNYLRVPESSF